MCFTFRADPFSHRHTGTSEEESPAYAACAHTRPPLLYCFPVDPQGLLNVTSMSPEPQDEGSDSSLGLPSGVGSMPSPLYPTTKLEQALFAYPPGPSPVYFPPLLTMQPSPPSTPSPASPISSKSSFASSSSFPSLYQYNQIRVKEEPEDPPFFVPSSSGHWGRPQQRDLFYTPHYITDFAPQVVPTGKWPPSLASRDTTLMAALTAPNVYHSQYAGLIGHPTAPHNRVPPNHFPMDAYATSSFPPDRYARFSHDPALFSSSSQLASSFHGFAGVDTTDLHHERQHPPGADPRAWVCSRPSPCQTVCIRD